MESDKVSTILDKVESKAGLIGGILGFMGDPMADGRGISSATLQFMMARIKGWHIPNVSHTLEIMMQYPQAYPVFDYAMGAIGGWIMQEAGGVIDGKITAVGRIVKKMSLSALFANIASAFIWIPAVNPGGGGASTASMNPQTSFAVGGPGTPHATGTNGYKATHTFESVVA